jgi:hypothetical protein
MRKMLFVVVLVLLTQFAMAEWEVVESEDLMAGTTTAFLFNEAAVSQGTLMEPAIAVRKDGEGYESFIHWGGYSLDSDSRNISVKFDDKDPETFRVSLSSDGEAVFMTEGFLEELMDSDEVVVLIYSATGRKMVAMWNVSGLRDKISLIK